MEHSPTVLHRGRARADELENNLVELAKERGRTKPTAEERDHMIAVAAYYISQRRSMEPGHELEDWLEAEAQIDAALAGME
jgi:hypothetical protein